MKKAMTIRQLRRSHNAGAVSPQWKVFQLLQGLNKMLPRPAQDQDILPLHAGGMKLNLSHLLMIQSLYHDLAKSS
jgi:hypothetical protein